MNEKLRDSFNESDRVLDRLKDALEESANALAGSLMIDGTIQRFEFCVELFWKLMKRVMEHEKLNVSPFPKAIMQQAFAAGWIKDEAVWLNMLNDRNQTSHTYNQTLAKEIFERISIYYPVMQSTYDALFKQYNP